MRRVVVTGLGALGPCGLDVPTTWDAICAGRSGIGRITRFDAAGWKTQISGEVDGFDPTAVLSRAEIKRMDRFAQFALVASVEAMADAGIGADSGLGERGGVYLGSGIGGLEEIERGTRTLDESGARRISPFFIPRCLANLAAGHVAIRYGLQGPSLCVSTACATGNHAIGEAWRVIRSGDADVIVAGGSEAALTPLGVAGFMVMRALSRGRNDTPEAASRPFDVDRDGFVMGEGAGVVVLEELSHAKARGARIYGEVVGYALTNDAHHMTAPPAGHAGAVRCMRAALRVAGMDPSDVDYINAHGTSTPSNDLEEGRAIQEVMGPWARRVLVSSTKSMTGHLLGAAGGIEAVISLKGLFHGVVPPTINLDRPEPELVLDLVPHEAREVPIRTALSNAFGFGGTNAVLAFRAFDG